MDDAPVTLDRNGPVPIYAQLDEILRRHIDSGEWAAGMMVPSENAIARDFGISRMTARGVLNSLADEGLLVRVPGKGTFVAEPKIETASTAFHGIRAQLESQGFTTSTRLVRAEQVPASARVARKLGIATGTPLTLIERVRSVGDEPISVHRSWVPAALAPNLIEADVVGEQLCTILDRDNQLRAAKVNQHLESIELDEADATLLGLTPGLPALLLEDVTSNAAGPYEFSRITFRGDRIRLGFTFDIASGEVSQDATTRQPIASSQA